MYIEKLASLIINDVTSGLRGYHLNLSLNPLLVQDEIVQTRLSIIHLYFLKGIFPIKDLLIAINCIDVDCESLERCKCGKQSEDDTLVAHFQIPQLVSYYGKQAIDYIGSTDRLNKFTVITSLSDFNNRKYRKRALKKPYVWIDYAPNSNGMLDCFLFNAPLLLQVSVVAVFKDPRLLNLYSCCNMDELNGPDVNTSFIDLLVKEKLTKEKIYFYRQLLVLLLPNDLQYVTGG